MTILAKNKHGFSVHTPCKDYIDLQIKENKRTAAQIHRLADSDENVALVLAGYQENFPEAKNPSYMFQGEVSELSGYKNKYPREKSWLEGNLGHPKLKYKAGVYILRQEALVLDEIENEVGDLLGLAKKNAEKDADLQEQIKVKDKENVELIGKSPLWEMSTAVYATGDSETEEDTLGFGPYVEAVAEFLVHEETQPPLTISIEGEWGSGKSSFMRQLQKEIRRIYAEQAKGTCFVVEFDPWRHDKDEALWAAFVLTFLKQIRGGFFKIRRWIGDIRLFLMRYRWSDGWLDFFRFIGFWAAFAVLCVVLAFLVFTRGSQWVNNLSNEILGVAQEINNEVSEDSSGGIVRRKVLEYFLGGGGLAALVGGLMTFSGLIKKVTGNPLDVNLKKYLKQPRYSDRVSFIDQLHSSCCGNDFT